MSDATAVTPDEGAPSVAEIPVPVGDAAASVLSAGPSMRQLAVRGSLIEIFGYVVNQGLRLVTNLVLSRLLFPEAYGLTAIVTVFMVALGMLTDVGLRDSIISNERGDDLDFLNTAWTIQVVRGFILWGLAAVAAYPVAWIYREPQLVRLIGVASFAMVIHGFSATKPHTLSRRVQRGSILFIEVASKVISMVVMFLWAWKSPTVWSLVAGGLTSTICEVVGSHLLRVGYNNWFRWEKEAAQQITSFGKWIVGSSAFTFLAGEGDRILLGRFLSMATLGIYSVAGLLSSAVGQVVNRLAFAVFFGLFSRVARERPHEVSRAYYKARLRLDLLAMPALGAVIVLGPTIVGLLYDSRYHDAGWMLRYLCVRVGLQCILYPCGVCLIALGRPRPQLYANAARFVTVWIGIPIGFYLGGLHGVLYATTVSELPMLVVFWVAFKRLGHLRLSRELVAVGAVVAGGLIGLLIKVWIGPYLAGIHLPHRHH